MIQLMYRKLLVVKIIWLKMSIVLRLRNSVIMDGRSPKGQAKLYEHI